MKIRWAICGADFRNFYDGPMIFVQVQQIYIIIITIMGSPTKEKFKEGVQQEILTNYYLSKYDKFMSRMNERKVQTTFAQREPSFHSKAPNPKRKNFKELILQKRANQREQPLQPASGKRNFKHEIEHKHSREKVEKENKRNFYRLEDTIISQLYKPSPSQLEKGKYSQIEVLHKISYDQKRQRIQPFKLGSPEDDQNIDIKYQNQEPQILEVSMERIQHQKLSNAIRSSFQKRKSPTNRAKTKSKAKEEHFPPKSPQNRAPPRYQESQTSRSREESYYFQNVRPSFENMQNERQVTPQNEVVFQSNSLDKRLNVVEDDRQSTYSRRSKGKSIEKNNFKVSRKSSISPSEKKKNSSIADDSFHRSIPEIEHEPKISPRQEKESQKLKPEERSEGRMSDNRSMKSSRVHNESEMKDSLHDFSMISRFSMISEEGTIIREELQKQLNENEFGPYQNALTSLLDLLGEHPNAWPIFVVGQRILEDRHLYENKRMMQQNEISRLQAGIQAMKRAKQKRNQVQSNNIKILNLVRHLSSLVSSQKN